MTTTVTARQQQREGRPSSHWSPLKTIRILLLVTSILAATTVSSASDTTDGHDIVTIALQTPSSTVPTATEEPGCANCASVGSADKQLVIKLKVEAIKQQILSKLHLEERPNITVASIPRELVLEALRRARLDAEDVRKVAWHHRVRHRKQRFRGHHEPGYAGDEPSSSHHEHRSTSSSQQDDYYGKTSEVIAFAEPGSQVNNNTILEFSPPQEQVDNLQVTSATLWIQLRRRRGHRPRSSSPGHATDHQAPPTLYVFRTSDDEDSRDGQPRDLELLATRRLTTGRPGWKHIELRDAVQAWYKSAHFVRDKLTLLVDCVGCDSSFELALFGDTDAANAVDTEEKRPQSSVIKQRPRQQAEMPATYHRSSDATVRPFLTIATKSVTPRRKKRAAITCDATMSTCCRQSLYVSFKELGWDDWIIAPKGYFANYCQGDCRRAYRTPDTLAHFHSHVLEEYRNRNPYASIAPCCAPTRLSSTSLIYFDPEYNIIKAELPKMVVEECGCT